MEIEATRRVDFAALARILVEYAQSQGAAHCATCHAARTPCGFTCQAAPCQGTSPQRQAVISLYLRASALELHKKETTATKKSMPSPVDL